MGGLNETLVWPILGNARPRRVRKDCNRPRRRQWYPSPTAPKLIGHEGGNGGDVVIGQNTGAWFLTEFAKKERPVEVCLKIAAGFGVDEYSAKSLLEATAAAWRKYLAAQNIATVVDGKAYRPASTLKWTECTDTTDLTVYLGATNPQLDDDRRHFANPLAYVGGQSYTVLIQRAPGTDTLSRLWLLVNGHRLRMN